MCGFLGYWGKAPLARSVFEAHLARMRHRGPDHVGILELDGLCLGHNRLAIIDLDQASNQPMVSACGRLALVFNGEIYNYLELKEELRGYPFRTHSDTEVILAAYLTWGERFVTRLTGMFSLALYDRERSLILLARDPIGKKPLYYSHAAGFVAFASEIKGLSGLPGIGADLDAAAVNEYFSAGYIGGQRTVFQAISQLPAGHMAIFSLPVGTAPSLTRYWRLPVADVTQPGSENELLDELDVLLTDAVRIRMRSDVPLGAFLSGGLDSSLVVALASRISPVPLRTFTISFPGTSSDEANHAARIANHFGTRHTVYEVGEEMLSCFPGLMSQLDQPFADSSLIPMHFVCREARRDVTVALSGDGGDELFGGYGHYDAFAWENHIRQNWPRSLRKLLGQCALPLPERHRTRTLKRLIFDDPYESMGAYASRFFNFSEREKLLRGLVRADSAPEREFLSRFLPNVDWLQNICQADFQNYMVDDILVKVDRMSMLNSLEVRSPLLDHRIAEFAFSRVPSCLKRKGVVKKYLVKQLARRYLPADFAFERKHGFGVPLGQWFDSSLGDRLADLLSGSPSGCVDRSVALRYLKLHRRGFSNYSKKLFAILVWEEWFAAQREATRAV